MTAPSPRVQLEVAILEGDTTAPAAPAPVDEHTRLTVLIVAAEADLRGYVRECLRARADLRVVEAESATAARRVEAACAPALLIVDEPEREALTTSSRLRGIVIVDDLPRGAPAYGARIRWLARPFSAQSLVAEVAVVLMT